MSMCECVCVHVCMCVCVNVCTYMQVYVVYDKCKRGVYKNIFSLNINFAYKALVGTIATIQQGPWGNEAKVANHSYVLFRRAIYPPRISSYLEWIF